MISNPTVFLTFCTLQAVHIAAQYGQTTFLYHIVTKYHADFDVPDNDGRSPLHWYLYKHILLLYFEQAFFTLEWILTMYYCVDFLTSSCLMYRVLFITIMSVNIEMGLPSQCG